MSDGDVLTGAEGTAGGNTDGGERGSSEAAADPMKTTSPSAPASTAAEAANEMVELAGGALTEPQITAAAEALGLVIAKGFRISESSQGPTAKRARFTCDTCKGTTYIEIPFYALAWERSELMKKALDEHRFLCPVGLVEDMRTYKIEYPR